jgi:sulfur-carrier protein
MRVKVKLFGQFRYITNGKEVEVEIQGHTVQDVISSLVAAYPDLGKAILSDHEIKPYVNVMLNGKSVKDKTGLATTVTESDELVLFPPMAGG